MFLLYWNEPRVHREAVDIRDNSYVSLDMPHKDLISHLSVESSKDNTKIIYTCSFKTEVISACHKNGIISWRYEVSVV